MCASHKDGFAAAMRLDSQQNNFLQISEKYKIYLNIEIFYLEETHGLIIRSKSEIILYASS